MMPFLSLLISLSAIAGVENCSLVPKRPGAEAGLLNLSQDLQTQLIDYTKVLPEDVPNPGALLPWQDVVDYATSTIDVNKLPHVPVNCKDPQLYPTNPQESTKMYHVYKSAKYSQSKLQAGDSPCVVGMKTKNTAGIRPCLKADELFYVLMSDTFRDACGNYYRGVWRNTFLGRDENMGTLFGKGRTMYPARNPLTKNDMQLGDTYSSSASDFAFLTPLFPGDKELAEKEAANALQNGFQKDGLIFKAGPAN